MGPRYESSVSTGFRFRCIRLSPLISCRTPIVESFASEDAEQPNSPGRERTLAQTNQDAKGEFQ
jgi:hypothetical protein